MTKTELFAGGRKLIALPSLAEMEGVGAGPDLKRAGVHDLYIVPLGAAVEQSKTPAASAVLYVDRSIPFRMLIETIFTIWQSGFGRIILATEGDAAPSAGETHGFLLSRPEEGEQRMGAYVLFLVNSGISVKLLGENVGEECKDIAPGIAVPRKAGAHDFAGLTRCLALLKPRAEQATRTHLVDPNLGYVTAAPKTSYEDIIHALQSLHDAGIGGVGFKVPQ